MKEQIVSIVFGAMITLVLVAVFRAYGVLASIIKGQSSAEVLGAAKDSDPQILSLEEQTEAQAKIIDDLLRRVSALEIIDRTEARKRDAARTIGRTWSETRRKIEADPTLLPQEKNSA